MLVAPKRPPGFWFFSIDMGAGYSIELNSIETYAPNFLDIINNLFLGSAWYSGSFYKGLLWKWRTDGTNKLTFYVDCKGIVLTRASRRGEWSAAWHHSRRRRWRGDTRRTMFSVVAESRLFSFHPGNPPPATQFLIACCLLCWTGFNWFIGQTNFNVGQTHGRIRYGQPRSQQSQWTPAGNCTKQARMWSQSTF